MKLVKGNRYVCIKELDNGKNSRISIGVICVASKDGLYGYDNNQVYVPIKPLDDYGEYFTLYDESPYNRGNRELREKYAGMAMQALIPYYEGNPSPRTYPDDCAKSAVEYADALIEILKK